MSPTTPLSPTESSPFIQRVAEFADQALHRCRDRYGPQRTPLLTDGIHLSTGEPIRWEGHVLSNLACQQNFLRILEGLTQLTGETRYRQQAEEWIAYAFTVLRDPASDLLYWGGHTCFDLETDQPLLGNHELKCAYPYYRFLHRIHPEATQRFIEGFWHRHIQNWSNLLFNRHGEYQTWDRTQRWAYSYQGGPLPIIDNTMLSFINTGSDLIYAGALLSQLSGDPEPLRWARWLLQRYDDMRDETTGLGGYQFNHREPCRVRLSFKPPLGDRKEVNEATVITNGVIQTRYGRAVLTWLNLYEELGAERGSDFLNLAIRDLTALAEYSYDAAEAHFIPVLLEGTKLSPSDVQEGVGYCSPQKLRKVPPNGLLFWAYARAYRLSREELFRQMAYRLAVGMGWIRSAEGSSIPEVWRADFSPLQRISPPPRDGRALPNQNDAGALFGLLELYQAIGHSAYLDSARDLGERLVQDYGKGGFFTTGAEAKEGVTHLDNAVPLALLHLAAAMEGKTGTLPRFYPNLTDFGPKVIVYLREKG